MLGGRECLTLPGEHSPGAACQPSWGLCCPGQAGLSSSAALQPQRDAQASGYHQGWAACKVTHHQPSASPGAPWGFLPWLVSHSTARGSWEAPPAPPALPRPLRWLGGGREG